MQGLFLAFPVRASLDFVVIQHLLSSVKPPRQNHRKLDLHAGLSGRRGVIPQ
jgi:hypothetical protein